MSTDDLVALVRRWEQETPQAPAIVAGDTVLTYGQLGARSDALAHALATAVRDAGGDQSTVVPLVLDRSPDLFVAMLATWKAGLPYSVIDPTEPPARMSTMLADLTAPVVVTRSDLTPHLPDHPPPVVLVDHDHPPGSDTLEWIGDGSLAYVLYTSGSTGTPKGVMVTREAVSSFCGWQRRFLGVSAVDRASQLASPSFDGSNVEYWPYLSAGASVHLVPEPLRADPAGLIAWLADNAITHAFAPTPIAEMLLSDPDVVRLPLRTLMTGGDVLHRRPPHGATFTLLNMYGPTETTIASTYAVVGPGPSGEPAPVGFPVDGTVVRVLDDSGQPVPAGVTGEIFIGGVGLARGYHRQPALTAASFVPDPFASVPGSRMYRTGDVGFLRPDGALVVTGRRDRQVKIRGMRVELGEIEAALLTVDGVVASAARLWRDGDRQTLVGYVVVEPGATLGPDDVRATLGRRLPGHMVPGSVVVLPELPLTDRGKVDYRRLPAPGPRPPRPPDAFPLSDHERLLCQVWADMLGVATVGPHDDFYALGGHSLLAMRISARLRHEHGIDLRVSDILERPTIAELAALIGKQSPRSREGRPS